jgi:class 3 adenylate cyclase
MAADELVALLDRILSAFDRLADGARVEKIKTIGDAYMVAGGLPEPRPDHLGAVARMALAMLDKVAALAEETGRD